MIPIMTEFPPPPAPPTLPPRKRWTRHLHWWTVSIAAMSLLVGVGIAHLTSSPSHHSLAPSADSVSVEPAEHSDDALSRARAAVDLVWNTETSDDDQQKICAAWKLEPDFIMTNLDKSLRSGSGSMTEAQISVANDEFTKLLRKDC